MNGPFVDGELCLLVPEEPHVDYLLALRAELKEDYAVLV
jgi:hypothetical protein